MSKTKVAVIFGGKSSEHEVSKVSAKSVIENIDKEKFEVEMIGITKEGVWLLYEGPTEKLETDEWQNIALKNANFNANIVSENSNKEIIIYVNGTEISRRKYDVIFPVLHGLNGEDGTVQGLFELAGIPYVGCGVMSSAVGMDKAISKVIFSNEGIPQGKFKVFFRNNLKQDAESIMNEVENNFNYPCFVKPSNAGSSVGVSKAHNRVELFEALHEAAKYDRKILVEEFIDGREVECAVLGNEIPVASTVGEVVPCNEYYDYKAKYIENKSEIIIPADLPIEVIDKVRNYAIRAYKALDCSGLARVDFFVHKKTGEVYINEINTLPGFTNISMYPKLWQATGISYSELLTRLIHLAIERFYDNEKKVSLEL